MFGSIELTREVVLLRTECANPRCGAPIESRFDLSELAGEKVAALQMARASLSAFASLAGGSGKTFEIELPGINAVCGACAARLNGSEGGDDGE